MRVLVPGGAGFIGSEVVRRLLGEGHEAAPAEPAELPALLTSAFDAVVFCQGGRSADLAQCREAHVETTKRVLDRVRPGRVVYLSSGEVYGRGEVPFSEDAPLLGTSPYAVAKIEGEQAVLTYVETTGAAGFVLRLGVVYGPGQAGAMLVPGLLRALVERRRLPMSAGDQTRDFVTVQDVTRLVLRCLDEDAPPGIYNGGTATETPVADVARRLAEQASQMVGVDLTSLVGLGELPHREGEQMRYVLADRRTSRALGWRAEVGLQEGLHQAVQATFTSDQAS